MSEARVNALLRAADKIRAAAEAACDELGLPNIKLHRFGGPPKMMCDHLLDFAAADPHRRGLGSPFFLQFIPEPTGAARSIGASGARDRRSDIGRTHRKPARGDDRLAPGATIGDVFDGNTEEDAP